MSLTISCDDCHKDIPTNGLPTHKIICNDCHKDDTARAVYDKDKTIEKLQKSLKLTKG